MSPASIDRLLGPCRVAPGKRARCGTRPGTLLRSQIPVLVEHRDIDSPRLDRGRFGGPLRR